MTFNDHLLADEPKHPPADMAGLDGLIDCELCAKLSPDMEQQAARVSAQIGCVMQCRECGRIYETAATQLQALAARVKVLEAENERLRAALEPFTFREDGDDEAVSIQHPSIIVRCEVTYGDIQLARAALEARHD